MASITYTAKRQLAAGHVLNTSYSLEFNLRSYSPDFTEKKSENASIDGTAEVVLWNLQELRSIGTSKFLEADLPVWMEFFASVAARESFIFDAYGTIATPANPVTVERTGKHQIKRAGTQKKFTSTFKVKVL